MPTTLPPLPQGAVLDRPEPRRREPEAAAVPPLPPGATLDAPGTPDAPQTTVPPLPQGAVMDAPATAAPAQPITQANVAADGAIQMTDAQIAGLSPPPGGQPVRRGVRRT